MNGVHAAVLVGVLALAALAATLPTCSYPGYSSTGAVAEPTISRVVIAGLAADGRSADPPPLPTPTPVPPPPAPLVSSGCPELIVDTFGVTAAAACDVAYCESTWQSWVVGAAGEVGWFQIHPVHFPYLWATYGAAADLSSPAINVAYAYSLSRGGTNWSAWTCRP